MTPEREHIKSEITPIRTSKMDAILDRDLNKVLMQESQNYEKL